MAMYCAKHPVVYIDFDGDWHIVPPPDHDYLM